RIREFTIDQEGMHLGRPFRNITGILAGTPVQISPSDLERVWGSLDSDKGKSRKVTADVGEPYEGVERRRSS
ncbi:MAG: hypothetical protein ACJ785_09625, partial [Gemmatimonadaceae bacterium]